MLKTFWPLKGLLHTYTHILPCIPVEFQAIYSVSTHLLYQMGSNIDNKAI